jgi:PKD repeat protein
LLEDVLANINCYFTLAMVLDGTSTYVINNISSSPYTLFAKTLGNYQILSVSDSLCTNNKDTSIVTIKGDSVIIFSDVTSDCEPQEIVFWSNVNGLNGDCIWSFGDGSDSLNLCDTVLHTYYSSDSYAIQLTVNSLKCSGSAIIPN